MNLNEDTFMHDTPIITSPPMTNSSGPHRRFGRYRDQLAQQPRTVSLRDFGYKDDAPSTPPSASKRNLMQPSSEPPECPRNGRPINRRLLLSEAQERLSLPDLFAPRTPAPTRRRVRAVPHRPSLMAIQPRMENWGDFSGEAQSHSMSQRSFVNYMNPAEF